ncbi:MAG TPA: hypothetical protein VGE30_02170 [Candidatus Saccharimonadales bacterium]
MAAESDEQKAYLSLLNTYPSPHNGQPIRLKRTSANQFELYFQRERGLSATDVSYIFSFVSMGVFVAYAQACGQALGHTVVCSLTLPKQEELRGTGPVQFGNLTVQWNSRPAESALKEAILFRQTSRKKYTEGLSSDITASLIRHAAERGMQLGHLDPKQAHQAIWLNQRAVFDDMFDEAVRQELDHWLRYSKQEKESKRDGLAYDCMELNGAMMKFIVKHPNVLRAPGIAQITEKYYLRTMKDASDVFYMLAPFSTERESYEVGMAVSDIWLRLSRDRYYIHPFGTIMSNHAAHHDFLKLAGIEQENATENYLVFIFRAGRSAKPKESLRLPYDKHLIME